MAKLVTYFSSQDCDQEPQELGLFEDNDAGLLSACLELLNELGYNVYKEDDEKEGI